jgi:NhaP-type Na+/H+ or K+/H+ antiporter
MYAVVHGLPESDAKPLIGLTLATITVSTLVHGVSARPLMKMYSRMAQQQR